MNRSLVVVLVAGAMLAGCSSKGEAGPVGPSGPRGDQGLQGSPGQPGEPVLSAQLSVGSLHCPNGGSQFSSVSGTTFACSGADGQIGPPGVPGPSGPPGPVGPSATRVVLKTANGEVIGPVVGFSRDTRSMTVDAFVERLGMLARLFTGSGRLEACPVYFTSSDCSGPAFVIAGGFCEGGGRTYFSTTGMSAPVTYFSSWGPAGTCVLNPTGSETSAVPAQELTDPRYPYAAPLQIAFE